MRPPITEISAFFADAAVPATFPQHVLRFRNRRWAEHTGLTHLTEADWNRHFAKFAPLPDNLEAPLALRYHGHQFHVYNPNLGDGRGFLFAQIRDDCGRLLDLGTKGSGQTRWSRQGDGRLTLKGGVREVLAASYLEALGVNTSKAFSLIETGEALHRSDEPSPTRSSVLVRLSHSHIRFGTFQRAAHSEDKTAMVALIAHIIQHYYPDCDDEALDISVPALFECIVDKTARMIGQWMAVGFVHGVMNTDNFNITGETFDFGPWRFLPHSDPNFTAAYFDEQGLYRFGRQPTQGLWALQQLGQALTLLVDADRLSAALQTYERAYQDSLRRHTFALLGIEPTCRFDDDMQFLQSVFAWLTHSEASWPYFFFDWFGGEASQDRAAQSPQKALYQSDHFVPIAKALFERTSIAGKRLDHPYFHKARPVDLLYETVESIWAAIAGNDNWQPFEDYLADTDMALNAYDWPHP